MNGLLLGVLGAMLLFTWDGYRKGLIRKLVGLVAWALTLGLFKITVPYITEALKEHTAVYTALQNGMTESDMEMMQMLRIMGLKDMAAEFVADRLLQLVAFVVTFILVSVVVHGAAWALHIAASLPLLHGINRILGAGAGFLEGLFLVWVVFLVIGAFATSTWGDKALGMIADSGALTWLFVNNPLLKLILK